MNENACMMSLIKYVSIKVCCLNTHAYIFINEDYPEIYINDSLPRAMVNQYPRNYALWHLIPLSQHLFHLIKTYKVSFRDHHLLLRRIFLNLIHDVSASILAFRTSQKYKKSNLNLQGAVVCWVRQARWWWGGYFVETSARDMNNLLIQPIVNATQIHLMAFHCQLGLFTLAR